MKGKFLFLCLAVGLAGPVLAATEAEQPEWVKAYMAPLEAAHGSPEEKQGLKIYETQYLMD